MAPFRFRDMGGLVSLGHYNAFGTLGRHGFFGDGFIEGRSHALLCRLHQMELYAPCAPSPSGFPTRSPPPSDRACEWVEGRPADHDQG